MEKINWPRYTICLDDFENRGRKKTLSVTDVWQNKFEGRNAIDDLSFPF